MDNMDPFFNTASDFYVLFNKWHVKYAGGIIGSCCAVFILAVFFEAVKVARHHLLKASVNKVRHRIVETQTDERSLILEQQSEGELSFLSRGHLLQTFLHFIQIVISYSLMLIVMTYNVYLCLSVFLGATFGYFIFAWTKTIDVAQKDAV
ncbi:high affinity copper uptake protein 1-like [Amphiura filiformis]|uniref:high affinity copper uptake protein 1-like n=1 Tax=Amphiura filiformis TaxID=82378 RepID=UPI003B20FBF8